MRYGKVTEPFSISVFLLVKIRGRWDLPSRNSGKTHHSICLKVLKSGKRPRTLKVLRTALPCFSVQHVAPHPSDPAWVLGHPLPCPMLPWSHPFSTHHTVSQWSICTSVLPTDLWTLQTPWGQGSHLNHSCNPAQHRAWHRADTQ